MDYPHFLRAPGTAGSRFAGVFQRRRGLGDLFEAVLLGTDLMVLFTSEVPDGCFTIYDAVVEDTEPVLLVLDFKSIVVPFDPDRDFQLNIKEICAGMGGIGLGVSFMNGNIVASLDSSSLACEHLLLNRHGEVLCRDLCNDSAKGELHVSGGHAPILAAGFPCQPHSTQGMQLGSKDPRHKVLTEILRTAYLHMVSCLVLECTPQAQFDQGVRQEIQALANFMGWKIHETTLALSHQWPCRRHRWWVILCPESWDTTTLLKWPEDHDYQTIHSILPGWGLWPLHHETELQLTDQELHLYSDTQFGDDARLLDLNDRAPTFLHSYGSICTGCPCGCRVHPFSEQSLRSKGLRGCFVVSRLHGQPRHLHPMELFALHGVPLTVTHLPQLRAALSLIGQLASPLQALWVFSCLASMAAKHDINQTMHTATELLNMVKRQLVRTHYHMWQQSDLPRQLHVVTPDGSQIEILTAGSTTVAQLLRAESFTLARGEMLHLLDGPRALPDDQILLEQGAYGPYCIMVTQAQHLEEPSFEYMISIEYLGDYYVAFVRPGSFLFQALQQCDVAQISHCIDGDGKFYGLDYRIWGSLRLIAQSRSVFQSPQMAFGLQATEHIGLTDVTVWSALVGVCRSTLSPYEEPPLMVTPSMAKALIDETATPFQCHGLRALYQESNGDIFCIFAANNHWALLCGTPEGQTLAWTYLDGLRSFVLQEATKLAWTLSQVLKMPFGPVVAFSMQPQTYPHTCGTLAIMHLCLIHGLEGHFAPEDELRLHNLLASHQHTKTAFRPMGKGSTDLSDRLAAFLVERGVPDDAALQRAQDAIKTLGAAAITDAFQTANPWATLKGLASRPSTRFRWVKEAELKQHIEQQARKKHGAHIPKAKQKKQTTSPMAKTPQVDPTTLKLLPDTFVDGDGDEIPQIPFEEVGQDATGLAFCTYQDAKPFIEAAEIISSTTLGLLINTEVPMDFCGDASISHLCFPALCTATDEPLLLHGSLLILSDGSIQRKERSSPQLAVPETNILKVQIFQDELAIPWKQITDGPIRALLQLVPQLRLCSGRQCGKECALFHAPVGEALPGIIMDIWARSYCNLNGKNTKPEHAQYFQVMLRIPTVALDFLLRAGIKGVYLEPRSSKVKGPHEDYCVIWLAGHDRDQAIHKLRTCTHGIAIARLNTRYGVRVSKKHEKKTHEELRPDDEYIDVDIRQVYTVFPVPFGLQRSQMAKLLEAWAWPAKPLQPIKGNLQGQAWTIGADQPPPNKVMPAFGQDVLITLQKDIAAPAVQQPLVASTRTKKFLKEGQASSANPSTADPWFQGPDPWSTWKKPISGAPSFAPASSSRFSQIQDTIKEEIQKQVQQQPVGTMPTQDIQKLEVNIAELQAQGTKFHQWFQEAGQRMTNSESQLGQLRQVVEQQGQAVAAQINEIQQEVDNKTQILQNTLQGSMAALSSDITSKLTSQFDSFEAMLAKKSRSE